MSQLTIHLHGILGSDRWDQPRLALSRDGHPGKDQKVVERAIGWQSGPQNVEGNLRELDQASTAA